VDIQKGRFQQIRIQESAYGLGAFAVDHIPKGKVVGEYVGESYKEDSLPKFLSPMQKHVKLNYLFTWTEKPPDIGDNAIPNLSLDSWHVGNETRYLNHSDARTQNCESIIYLVNGSYRIVLCTLKPVRSGQELTLDYGEHYWLPDSDEEK
jgi:SET domain-containing protein